MWILLSVDRQIECQVTVNISNPICRYSRRISHLELDPENYLKWLRSFQIVLHTRLKSTIYTDIDNVSEPGVAKCQIRDRIRLRASVTFPRERYTCAWMFNASSFSSSSSLLSSSPLFSSLSAMLLLLCLRTKQDRIARAPKCQWTRIRLLS